MLNVRPKAPRLYRANTAICAMAGYGAMVSTQSATFRGKQSETEAEKAANSLLSGYPSNHIYRIYQNKILPKFQLYERARKVLPLWPEKLESLLDIGCCKGYYVTKAAQRPECKRAVGVDVYEPFIEASEQVSKSLELDNTQFYLDTIDNLAERPESFGGPFQSVLLIGTYHYLFWGSVSSPHCFKSHDEILSRLAALTTEQVIISARFELDRLPENVKPKAVGAKEAADYSTESFIRHAEKFFTVKHNGYLGTYPLFVLTKK